MYLYIAPGIKYEIVYHVWCIMYHVLCIMYDIMYYVSCIYNLYTTSWVDTQRQAVVSYLCCIDTHCEAESIGLLTCWYLAVTHKHMHTHRHIKAQKHIPRHSETKSKDCFVRFLSWVGVPLSLYLLLTCVSSESEWSKRSRKVTGWEETCARWSISCQVHISQEVPLSYRKTRQPDNKPTLISCHFLLK